MNKDKANFWKIKVNDRNSNINFSSLVGYVDATYEELVAELGEPEGDFDKSTAHWTLEAPNGTVATIYDYKTYMTPIGTYSWHIGGFDKKALLLVEFLLGKPVTDADVVGWNPYGGGNDQ
jgi:hypothetical protein